MLVLKIIGFILLGILALILLILGLVLFVPIRYKAGIKKNDTEFAARGVVSWLFKLIKVEFFFDGNTRKFNYSGKLAFLHLFGNQEEEQNVEESEKPYKESDEEPKRASEAREEPLKAKEDVVKEPEEFKSEPVQKPSQHESDNSGWAESSEELHENFSEAREKVRKEPEQDGSSTEQEREEGLKDSKEIKQETDFTESVSEENNKTDSKKELTFWDKVKNFWSNRDKAEKAYYKTRPHIVKAWKRIKRLLIHILPKKVFGTLEFGFDDPATTGKILGGIAAMYGITGPFLTVIPHFEEKYLDADINIRGRIRIFTVLIYAGLIYFNKHIRKLLKYFKHLSVTDGDGAFRAQM